MTWQLSFESLGCCKGGSHEVFVVALGDSKREIVVDHSQKIEALSPDEEREFMGLMLRVLGAQTTDQVSQKLAARSIDLDLEAAK